MVYVTVALQRGEKGGFLSLFELEILSNRLLTVCSCPVCQLALDAQTLSLSGLSSHIPFCGGSFGRDYRRCVTGFLCMRVLLLYYDKHVVLTVTYIPHTLENTKFLQRLAQHAADISDFSPLPQYHTCQQFSGTANGVTLKDDYDHGSQGHVGNLQGSSR